MTKQEIIEKLYETANHWAQESALCETMKEYERFQNAEGIAYLNGRKDVWIVVSNYLKNLTKEFEE